MGLVVKLLGLASGQPTPLDGRYLVEYDPDKRGVDPNGRQMLAHILTTPDRQKARVFEDLVEAHGYLYRPSRRWPTEGRMVPDAKPNRPLAAFTMEITAQ